MQLLKMKVPVMISFRPRCGTLSKALASYTTSILGESNPDALLSLVADKFTQCFSHAFLKVCICGKKSKELENGHPVRNTAAEGNSRG